VAVQEALELIRRQVAGVQFAQSQQERAVECHRRQRRVLGLGMVDQAQVVAQVCPRGDRQDPVGEVQVQRLDEQRLPGLQGLELLDGGPVAGIGGVHRGDELAAHRLPRALDRVIRGFVVVPARSALALVDDQLARAAASDGAQMARDELDPAAERLARVLLADRVIGQRERRPGLTRKPLEDLLTLLFGERQVIGVDRRVVRRQRGRQPVARLAHRSTT
jgi:hypothetical protein